MEFIKWDAMSSFLEESVAHYEFSAPTVSQYLDDLYVRINEGKKVYLREVIFVQRLKECNIWMHPNHAANHLYHAMSELGMSTVGHIGF